MAVAAAVFLVLAAGASGCAAAGPRHELGRPRTVPDRLAPVWTVPTETDFDAGGVAANVFAITGTAVVLPVSGGDLVARDPGTGRAEWKVAPDRGWRFSGDAVIGSRLYAYMTTPNESLARFAAYDLGTGQVAWRSELGVDLYRGIGLQQVMFTSRGIVVQLGAANLLYGLRLSDGKGTRLASLPFSCPGGDSMATPGAAIFLLECAGGGVVLDSVDPATGRVSWQRVLPDRRAGAYPLDLEDTSGGDVVAEAGTTVRIFTSGGRLIATRVPPTSCPGSCMIGSAGSAGAIVLGADANVVQGIDLATGRVQWQRAGALFSNQSTSVDLGGTMFAVAGPAVIGDRSKPLPVLVVALQIATGRSSVIPLPVASGGEDRPLAGTADGLLLVEIPGAKNPFITAFRPEDAATAGPAALGGVAAARWPDACTLLSPADLRFIAPGYVSSPVPAVLSGVTWPKPATCAYVGPGADDPAVTVSVAWVAASAQQAHELLASDLAILTPEEPPPGIPGGYLVYDGSGGVDRALVAAGPAIVEVTVPGSPQDARRLAPVVAARLHAIDG
jgi:outer membrane protein assembly factor BamB